VKWQGITLCAVGFALLTTGVPAANATEPLPLRQPGQPGQLGNERLSDEKTLTRFALANRRVTARRTPSENGRPIVKLHWYTEDFYDEIYIVLESRRVKGVTWVRVRLPGRPNGRTGWVPRWGLRPFRIVRTRLEINRRTFWARLYDQGRLVWRSRVGVGAPGTPTPRGRFWIRERAHFGSAGGPYGPVAFGTSAYSVLSDWPRGGVVGIHGTNAPSLIPGRPSHGCVRVPNHKILQLAKKMPIGTPVIIS
jgi:L,D-transpeptidase catalytic domain